jgi:hypothetical protein
LTAAFLPGVTLSEQGHATLAEMLAFTQDNKIPGGIADE